MATERPTEAQLQLKFDHAYHRSASEMPDVACVDLFCGAGGLTFGLVSEGIPVVAGIDIDEACRHPFEFNNGARFISADVASIPSEFVSKLFGRAKIRILAGCAPCQPFSAYTQRYDTKYSERWGLLYHFARLVEGILPEIVTMENVSTIVHHEVFYDFRGTLKRLGYKVWDATVDCTKYGLPQKRRRLVLLASRLDQIELISPTHVKPTTVKHAIKDLPPIPAGGSSPTDALHVAARLSPLNLERIRASVPGGTWRDWPEHLIAPCHRRATGKSYPSIYGRMAWDEPAPTLTTQFYNFGSGRFGHPSQDRAISLREGAILQGFPNWYSFVPEGEKIRFRTFGRLIGNAVPVALARAIGRSLAGFLGIAPRTTVMRAEPLQI